jgi:coenzyme F420 hydrogenase subunit beta
MPIPRVDYDKCTGCGECAEVCPPQAISVDSGIAKIDKNLCEECGECVKACTEKAITIPG